MKKVAFGLIILIGISVAGCGSKEELAPVTTSTPPAASTPAPTTNSTTNPADTAGGVGGQADASNGGMVELPAGGLQRG